KLSSDELIKLIQSVFTKETGDKQLAILVDAPRNRENDTSLWKDRRAIAEGWFHELKDSSGAIGLERVALVAYPDVGSNNADLPETAFFITGNLPETADGLAGAGESVAFETVFSQFQLFLAPTENSTTAPMKNAAKRHGFRAATMPGFSTEMIPALRLDYNEVFRRVSIIKEKVDDALSAEVVFKVDNEKEYNLFFDLRHRKGHLSAGRFPDKSTAGNLPSGETYIVPYEGEMGEKSKTEGILPVQLGNDVVFFTIKENCAVAVEGEGESVALERDHLQREPAYGNMAELGFGVLGDFGLAPIDEILLDEKLGFHIAFGRSDHFGGQVGPKDFSSPSAVIHLDRIYIPATQPRISLVSIVFGYENNRMETIIENGKYLVF
ncbi:MAG: hypothetical protein GY940_11425, partial [bacterium]|nr:hypothetical protein [bacterium]